MVVIDHVTLEATDTATAERFYAALGLDDRVRVAASTASSHGFRGFTLSLIVAQPGDADLIAAKAVEAGGAELKPAKKSLWGYGGVVQAPDGTICTIASSSKKDDGPATGRIDEVVLQLGVADVPASKDFYRDRGIGIAKSYGRKYVELDTSGIQVTLNKRDALAKVAGVPTDGSGSHRVAISSDAGAFTDPEGFIWEPSADMETGGAP